MDKPTRELVEEHGGIMLMLQIMHRIAEKLRNREEVKKDDIAKIIEFLKEFADKCHHGKEEDILFPELLKITEDEKLVVELLGEHKAARDLIKGMADSLESYLAGNPDAIHIAVNIDEYVRLLTDHIRKENIELFPKADKQLPEELQQKMKEQFDTLEREVIGVGKHEEYHGWLAELKKTYLD
jgi:hemerythrin-like domain-containing protein